jgi:hypothetical protein
MGFHIKNLNEIPSDGFSFLLRINDPLQVVPEFFPGIDTNHIESHPFV